MKLLFLIYVLFLGAVAKADCSEWFKKSKLKTGKSCIEKCVVLPTGMDTSFCPSLCEDLCSDRTYFEKLLGNYAYYPGLTSKEKELIRIYPNESITKYFLRGEELKRTGELDAGTLRVSSYLLQT